MSKNNKHYNGEKHSIWEHLSTRAVITFIVLAVMLVFGYLVWESYQPSVEFRTQCEKSYLHDGNRNAVWTCPEGVNY